MGFFKRKEHDKSPSDTTSMDPLVARLVLDHEPTFLSALEEADFMSQRGDYKGIQAIREAIRIRSGRETVNFKEFKDSSANPVLDILRLVKKRALLDNPGVSCGYITNVLFLHRFDPWQSKVSYGHITDLTYWYGGGVLGDLLEKIVRIGGPKAGHEFQLLCYEMGTRMKLMDACTRTGNWEEFFRLSE